ncbi:MAG: hypothetical protein K8M05_07985, partial [Deltaproteobacteria bacterium]|nr:hypothetical protein [Kofleriaceae bacterium]
AAAVGYAAFDLLETGEAEDSIGRPVITAGAGAVIAGLALYVWGESAVQSPRPRGVVERIGVAPVLGRDTVAFALTTRF